MRLGTPTMVFCERTRRTFGPPIRWLAALFLLGSYVNCQEVVNKRLLFEIAEGKPTGTYVGSVPVRSGLYYRFNEDTQAFRLNATSGQIFTASVLDREAPQSQHFDLVVLSSQPTFPIEVHITVLDINDNEPVFPESTVAISLLESTPAGTKVTLDTATDGDAGVNDVTDHYRIVSGNQDEHFRLEVTTNPSGEAPFLHLEVTGRLDWETQSFYQLNISAEDNGSPKMYGFMLVNVTIVDTNDNPPIFDQSDYTVSLNESVPTGTHVLDIRATDADDGSNGIVSYFIDDDQSQFEVDSKTGRVVTMQNRLSCYQKCGQLRNCNNSCVFTVRARDHGLPSLEGRAYITVNLLDDNDHAPVMKFNYRPGVSQFATVNENAKINEFVAAVSVTDADKGANGQTSVQIIAGNELNHFRLVSGKVNLIQVSSVLDREQINKYNLTFVATDMGTPPRSTFGSLIIHVNDINDHAPAFGRSEYAAVVSESLAVGSLVVSITATDEDTGMNSNIFYRISSGNDLGWFFIDSSTGLVTTQARLDREQTDEIHLKIKASDASPSPKEAETQLKVTILDENDNAPHFEHTHISVSLSESKPPGSLVDNLIAIDNDQGMNGTVSYRFHETVASMYIGVFDLNHSNGRVTTRVKLDRETKAEYKIVVVAEDHGSPELSSTATINLEVTDANDNSPEFYPREYFAMIPVNAEPGHPIAELRAYDKDFGENGIISFAVVDDSAGILEVDRDTGSVTLRRTPTSDDKLKHLITISAVDFGGRRAVKNAQVNVYINRSNTGQIEFTKPSYSVSIGEDTSARTSQIGQLLTAVKVKGLAPDTLYTIVDGDFSSDFYINKNTGELTKARMIDRESNPTYNLEIAAYDHRTFNTVRLQVIVEDTNDNYPQFDRHFMATDIEEILPVGHPVYLASAHDDDINENGKLTYSLTLNPDDTFSIDQNTGMIFLSKPISVMNVRMYVVEVTVSDHGISPLTTSRNVSITVLDVNDHTPLFLHSFFEVSLLESLPVNDIFFSVQAHDADERENGFVSYKFVKGNEENIFGIFPDGSLFLKVHLDREHRDYFELSIVASDHGNPSRSSTATLVVHVIDENDHSPVFDRRQNAFDLYENMPVNTFVGRLHASDQDIGRNADLLYAFETHERKFKIDPQTGSIWTLDTFDREVLESQDYQFRLNVMVFDNGESRRSDIAEIIIRIVDVNDNAPVFTRLPHLVEVSELAANGTLVTRVSASDADSGVNRDLIYSIDDGNEEERFKINISTGHIYVAGILDRETTDTYDLAISVSDASAENPLSVTGRIVLHVLDENDNEPEFGQTESIISIAEDIAFGSKLTQFSATDTDLGINQEIAYSIDSGAAHGTFRIDSSTGILYLDKPLDFETQTTYNLSIRATDSGNPSLSSTRSFSIIVIDVNDNTPVFPRTAIVKEIAEDTPMGSTILHMLATDLDSGSNGHLSYSFLDNDAANPFSIDAVSGEVSLQSPLDREKVQSYDVTVVATDLALPKEQRFSAHKHATIMVTDVNDNAPTLVSMDAVLAPSTARSGHLVTTVVARDADEGSNGVVTYRVSDGDRLQLFQLNPVSGRLTLARDLPRRQRFYQLTVTASDGAAERRHQMSADFVVTIIVADDNINTNNSSSSSDGNGPRFSQPDYKATVRENEPVGTRVLDVKASIAAASPPDARLLYYIVGITAADSGRPAERLFTVDASRGIITTTRVLDRERGDTRFTLDVAAVLADNDGGSLINIVKATVLVQDVNDEPPRFTMAPASLSQPTVDPALPASFSRRRDFSVNVSESTPVGGHVWRLVAVDADTIGRLSYSILAADDGVLPVIDVERPDTGVVVLRAPLDRELVSQYRLTARVSDGRHHTDCRLWLQVDDLNDNAPSFTSAVYSFDVSEDAVRGTLVGSVTARDPDAGRNGHVTYRVISDWANDVFSLDKETGDITLTTLLDYELAQHYILTVQASDGGGGSGRIIDSDASEATLAATTTVYINVLDVNDNEPAFERGVYTQHVSEAAPLGWHALQVAATDRDGDARLQYTLQSSGGAGVEGSSAALPFAVLANGTVVVTGPLDRERRAMYQLTVLVTDAPSTRHRPAHTSSAQITIHVDDVNDNTPRFTSPNRTWLMENAPLQQVVLPVVAVDRDAGVNGAVEYLLESIVGLVDADGNQCDNNAADVADAEVFSLDAVTGLLRVAGRLDRETCGRYAVHVAARDGGGHVARTRIQVTLDDANDNQPTFARRAYTASVQENATRGSVVVRCRAVDADTGVNGRLRYSLVAGDPGRHFAVDERSGVVRVARRLNYERRASYTLTVQVRDSPVDGNSRYDQTSVSVAVVDVNDHAPLFAHQPYMLLAMENRAASRRTPTPLARLTAVDSDASGSTIHYAIVDGNRSLFVIDAVSGQLSAVGVFDRESQDSYRLTVTATDNGIPRLTGTAEVHVLIQDDNDHAPQFTQSPQHANASVVTVSEAAPAGTELAQVTAHDADVGINALVRYSLSSAETLPFAVDAVSGQIRTTAALDRELRAIYTLHVVASDSALSARRSSATNVTVIVDDVNDSSPQFASTDVTVVLPDDAASGTFVLSGDAWDADSGENARVTYTLSGRHARHFSVQADTGVVRSSGRLSGVVRSALSGDTAAVLTFTLTASDHGRPARKSHAQLSVLLRPAVLFPQFVSPPMTASADEDAAVVLTVDEGSGGRRLTTLTARAASGGGGGRLRYALVGGNRDAAFQLDAASGQLSVAAGGVDRELSDTYRLWAEVSVESSGAGGGGGRSGGGVRLATHMPLTVRVLDVNDNAPQFERPAYWARVAEEAAPSQRVLQVRATDMDDGANGRVSYQLLAGDGDDDRLIEQLFQLDNRTGVLSTRRALDREQRDRYTLTVRAIDHGQPRLASVVPVTVEVLDKNDHPPLFCRLFSANITENAAVGSFVLQVTSSDDDVGDNARALYSFSRNAERHFALDRVSGNVTVAAPIDRERQSEYSLEVVAIDGSWQIGTHVTVSVQDVNDNAPRFSRRHYAFSVAETQRAPAVIGVVSATDDDQPATGNAEVSYRLVQPSDVFSIDADSGQISSRRMLLYHRSSTSASAAADVRDNQFVLLVESFDHGSPPLSSTCSVTVTVVDRNDHAPQFDAPASGRYVGSVPADAPTGENVLRVHAVDAFDSRATAAVNYTLLPGNGSRWFAVDADSGWISVRHTVRAQLGRRLTLAVRASDSGVPPQHTDTAVLLDVVGLNEHTPRFVGTTSASAADGTDNDACFVSEADPVGSSVCRLLADDADTGANGRLVFEIVAGNEAAHLALNASSGELSVARSLDYERTPLYNLTVRVSDSAWQPLSDTRQLSVRVGDVDDNRPVFERPVYTASIDELSPAGSLVTRVTATDADSARYAGVVYSVIGGSGRHAFAVDRRSGEIRSLEVFDYETIRQYTLDVLASGAASPHMHSRATVRVQVRGINEFRPRFVQREFRFSVSEAAPIGTSVGAVVATDADDGADGRVQYVLVGSSQQRGFSVDRLSGEVRLARRLDREARNRVVFSVLAKNDGPIRGNDTDTAQVSVTIQDGNDPPRFVRPVYAGTVVEGRSTAQHVTTVEATDSDVTSADSRFTYTILAGNEAGLFSVDRHTGRVSTVTALDREQSPRHQLIVAAVDTGAPPQTGTCVVRVQVADINDNAPQLSPHALNAAHVTENAPAGAAIVALSASDADTASNGAPFSYYVVGGRHAHLVDVEARSGRVTTRSRLDRETTPQLEFVVEVHDSGDPPMKAQFPISVTVDDRNDNPSTSRTVRVVVISPPPSSLSRGGDQQQSDGDETVGFPGGFVADIRPDDADSSGDYRCRLVSASDGLFSVPQQCRLHSTRVNGRRSFLLSSVGGDGLHDQVASTAHVHFVTVARDELRAAVVVRVLNTTANHLLASGGYSSLLSAVRQQLLSDAAGGGGGQAEMDGGAVVVCSLTQNGAHTDLTLAVRSATAATDSRGGRRVMRRIDVAQRLKGSRGRLQRALGSASFIIDHDPCTASPCHNGASCRSSLQLLQTDAASGYHTASSSQLVITSRPMGRTFSCRCVDGFSGPSCRRSSDPCRPNPCEAGGVCSPRTVSAGTGEAFVCRCTNGRSGERCQLKRAAGCVANPCQNGGECRDNSAVTASGGDVDRLPPGENYFCICRNGFRGRHCEQASDACRPNPCRNGGTCVSRPPSHECVCRPFFYGAQCDQSSWGFEPLAFMSFAPLPPVANDISVTFSTLRRDALLVYNFGGQTGGRSDFIALQLLDGRPQLVYGGALTAVTRLETARRVNDGGWHRVTATRHGRTLSLSVARCVDQRHCVQCDDSTDGAAPAAASNAVAASSATAVTSDCQHVTTTGPASSLSFTSPMFVGGVPSVDAIQQRPDQVAAADFVGCVDAVHVNGRRLTVEMALQSHAVLDTCPRQVDVCSSSSTGGGRHSCGPQARCIDAWSRRQCVCGDGADDAVLANIDCRRALAASSFHGGHVEFRTTEAFRRRRRLPRLFERARSEWRDGVDVAHKEMAVRVRTVASHGVILYAESGDDFTILQLRESRLQYVSWRGGSRALVNMTLSDVHMTDGAWHRLALEVRDTTLRVLVDGAPAGDALHAATVHDFADAYLLRVTLGGGVHSTAESSASTTAAAHATGAFHGCLAALTVDGEVQPFSGAGSLLVVVVSNSSRVSGVSAGCVAALASTDPLSVGVTLVIVFFVVLFVAIAASFVVFRLRRHRQPDELKVSQPANRSVAAVAVSAAGNVHQSGSAAAGVLNTAYADSPPPLTDAVLRGPAGAGSVSNGAAALCKLPPRPDIIERNGTAMSHLDSVSQQGVPDSVSEIPEHYDLENASSIAPSDIDIVYHYKGYRDGHLRPRYKSPSAGVGGCASHSSLGFGKMVAGGNQSRRDSPRHLLAGQHRRSPAAFKMQSTPLARLSPSSEVSQQPRILTLHDISGKPLPTALLNGGGSGGQRGLNSPVSHLSRSSGSVQHALSPSGRVSVGGGGGGVAGDAAHSGGTCSLVSTVDAVSSSSERRKKVRRRVQPPPPTTAPPPPPPPPPLAHMSRDGRTGGSDGSNGSDSNSSDDSGGNESFTCSEFDDYDTPGRYDKPVATTPAAASVSARSPGMIFSKLAAGVESDDAASRTSGGGGGQRRYDAFSASFRGSLSTLAASDDDVVAAGGGVSQSVTPSAPHPPPPPPPPPPPAALPGWDYLLNWGPSFQSLAGVFTDIAELRDSGGLSAAGDATQRQQRCAAQSTSTNGVSFGVAAAAAAAAVAGKPNEEYV